MKLPYLNLIIWLNVNKIFVTVVTGSTDGIGKEYCHELARKGINIVLIARNKEKLVNVANELGKLLLG